MQRAAAGACARAAAEHADDAYRAAERRYRRQVRVVTRKKKGRMRTIVEALPDDAEAFAALLDPREVSPRLHEAEASFEGDDGVLRRIRLVTVPERPGLILLPGVLTAREQLAWARRALEEFIQPPNVTSLNAQHGWQRDLWRRACAEAPAPPPPDAGEEEEVEEEEAAPAEGQAKEEASGEGRRGDGAGGGGGAGPSARELLGKLRWATLGYQYQWTQRVYEEGRREAFPPSLAALAARLAAAAGFPAFAAEAAIVNFYALDSAIGGHVDDAEADERSPIVSLSLGAPAVFLLGGATRAVEPLPLLLRSGDALLLAPPARSCYHGVPRVLAGALGGELAGEGGAEGPLLAFLAAHRLNINVRQVLPPGTPAYPGPARPPTAPGAPAPAAPACSPPS
eukprot:tig00001154_g7283.t1